ncbi:MAG: enoyl-CoA hydratase/isomerase family protein, partial [Myxococcales bacterium]|nr:enoyl-CoA hydratase/isomerase family protein [Myxococcales bacterium]
MQVLVRQEDTPVWRVRLAPGPGEEDVALDGPGLAALSAVLAQARASGCRVLVLDSAGPSFCRGMDLAKLVKLTPVEAEPALAGYARAIHEIATFPGITAAIVAADAVGGGVGLAAAVDLVLATDAARFSLPELLWGLVPGMVIPPLAARIGARAAQRLALTGATLDVDAALGLGL